MSTQNRCEICSLIFQASRRSIKTCSTACTSELKRRKLSKPLKPKPEKVAKSLHCLYCGKPRQSGNSFCTPDCYKAYDKEKKALRYAKRQSKNLTCNHCGSIFQHLDQRKTTCSPECAYAMRSKSMLDTLGYGNPMQKVFTEGEKQTRIDKMKATCVERFASGSPRQDLFLKDRGFSDLESFCKALIDFVEKTNCAPYAEIVTQQFKCSIQMIGTALDMFSRQDLLYKHNHPSSGEYSIGEFIKSLALPDVSEVASKRPAFMHGKELDVYIPERQFALEYHGLAHHSERPVFSEKNIQKIKTQHEAKYLLAKAAGVRLMQVFEDEWRDKRDIVASMITSRLGVGQVRIAARKCVVVELARQEAAQFFHANHIAGHTNCRKAFGLLYGGMLVASVSLRKPWQKNHGNVLELARFATLLNHQIIGGFSKLLKHLESYIVAAGFDGILTFADCRFGSGNVYAKTGFAHLGKTAPNYFYEKTGFRESRFKHRHDPQKPGTEREQQNSAGWYAIYDAGSEIYLLKIN